MFKNTRTTTNLLLSILVALSGLGAIVAGQQYLILQSEHETILARQTLDESFLSALKAVGSESNSEIVQQMARRKASIEGYYSAQADMIRQLEVRAMVDTIAWFVVIIFAGVALAVNWRKQPKSDVPPPVPPF